MGFKDFKKQTKLGKAVDSLKSDAKKPSYVDERFWSPSLKGGNASVVVRFLPQQDLAKTPILEVFKHGFQEKGTWFFENCPHTIGDKCPVCQHAQSIWDENEKSASNFWRNRRYFANVLIVKDKTNPENEGKVFLYEFGVKIYNKIMNVVAPEDEDVEPVNVFDFDNGVNFRIVIKQVSGFNNYDDSTFEMMSSAICDGDEDKQEKVFDQIHDLDQFKDPKEFKSYEALEKKFQNLLGSTGPKKSFEEKTKERVDEKKQSTEEEKPETKEKAKEAVKKNEDDDIDFDSLLNDDELFEDGDEIPFD